MNYLIIKVVTELLFKSILILLFITSTEQLGLMYATDFERLFDQKIPLFPYQNISPYETVRENIYDYQKQLSILNEKPDIIIVPIKEHARKAADFLLFFL